ncbi:putative aldo keto reductase protein [Eutypa lata UCREL1]|uniref:Putative aldo keto reductase protein n=1 Tax=Eutypa lata (strain UCR-EL1) TaxID=1287681 RepID=M7U0R3_EUTLA|nr:putative aldo keto reductase protein [Eutypa lata UCREL1]
MSIVWRLPVGEVAQQTRAEDILRVNRAHTITTEADEKNATQQYFDMINTWGSWEEFQRLLAVLSTIAQKHGRAVGAVIVGTRLGVSAHGDENGRVFGFELDDTDLKAINDSALGKDLEKAKPVYEKLGDCGNEYRAMH